MRKTIRLTEQDIRNIISEVINEGFNIDDYDKVEGKFAEIVYFPLLDSYCSRVGRAPYLARYGNEIYINKENGEVWYDDNKWESKRFWTYKECIEFCELNDIEVIKQYTVGASAANALGSINFRAVVPGLGPKDLSENLNESITRAIRKVLR